MVGGGVGGAGAARREGEWLRAYGRAAAMVPRVEELAAGRARLEAVNALQHESWEARDDRLQWRLLKADENMRMWEATCMAQQPSGDGRLLAELLKSENEDLEDFIQVLELENEELKIRVKEVKGGAGHCQNAAGHENIAGDLEAALRQLNQVHEALIAEKDKEISALIAEKDKEISALIAEKDKGFSALIAEKDLVREQFMTLERDYADLHSYSSKQEAQVTEAKQELEQLQVAFQKKDDEIRKPRARAKAAEAKRKLVPEGKRQEMTCMPKETDGQIEKCKYRQPETSEKCKKDTSETHTKNCSQRPALRGEEMKICSSKQMLVKDGQPQTSLKRKCVTSLPKDNAQNANDVEKSNQVLEPLKKKRVPEKGEVEQDDSKVKLANDLAPGLPDTPAPKKRPAEETAGSSGESTAIAAPKMKMNPGAQVKRRKVIGSKPTAGGSDPSPSEDPTSTAPDSTAPAPPAPPAEPAATEASTEPPTESAATKTAPAPPAKPAASKVAQSSEAPPATSPAKDIHTPEVEVTGTGFNPPVHTILAKHTGDSSKTERKFEAPDLSAFSVEELHAGFLSRLYTHRDEELALATQLKQKHEETVAGLRNTAAASQTAQEVAEEKLKVAVQTVGDLQKELSSVRKAAETEEANLRKRAEDAENRLKAASEELSGLREHVSRMTEAIFGKKSRQLSSDSILKLKGMYTLTEQLYCGAACAIKTLMRKRSVPDSLKSFLDTLSTLPDQINESRKSAARKGAVSALSLALAYSPELPVEEMAGGYPSLKEDGSAFNEADFDQCVHKARVLASTLADEEDLTKYQAAYNSANKRVPAPKFLSNDLTPSSSKQPFAQELDPSPFFEEGEFETLLHCNWDINNLEVQDPASEDPAQQ